jgi:hypothetical protein
MPTYRNLVQLSQPGTASPSSSPGRFTLAIFGSFATRGSPCPYIRQPCFHPMPTPAHAVILLDKEDGWQNATVRGLKTRCLIFSPLLRGMFASTPYRRHANAPRAPVEPLVPARRTPRIRTRVNSHRPSCHTPRTWPWLLVTISPLSIAAAYSPSSFLKAVSSVRVSESAGADGAALPFAPGNSWFSETRGCALPRSN